MTQHRRTKGTGSIREKAPGIWQIRYEVGFTPDGKRKERAENIKGTRRDAEKALRERIASIESASYVDKSREKIGQFLTSWIDNHTGISERTRMGYRQKASYIVTTLGGIQVQNLSPRHITGFHKALADRGLSNQSIQHAHRLLRSAMESALIYGIVPRNPVSQVKAPKVQRESVTAWDVGTIRQFLEAAADSPFTDVFRLAILTGLRRSELAGLTWNAIDFQNRTLRVIATLQRVSGKGLLTGEPKSQAGRRSVGLGESAIELLHSIRGKQLALQAKLGDCYHNPRGYVFTDLLGNPIDSNRLTREFHRIVKENQLPDATFHSLRHAHVSLLLNDGASLRLIAERVGHSDPSLTLKVYSHLMPGAQIAAADALDKQLG